MRRQRGIAIDIPHLLEKISPFTKRSVREGENFSAETVCPRVFYLEIKLWHFFFVYSPPSFRICNMPPAASEVQ